MIRNQISLTMIIPGPVWIFDHLVVIQILYSYKEINPHYWENRSYYISLKLVCIHFYKLSLLYILFFIFYFPTSTYYSIGYNALSLIIIIRARDNFVLCFISTKYFFFYNFYFAFFTSTTSLLIQQLVLRVICYQDSRLM